ncbi:MAG: GNAT family N-acetyltransferase [Aureispira sp.]
MISIEHTTNLTEAEQQQIFALLTECDQDFFPPLSSRASSTDGNFAKATKQLPTQYFESILDQNFILARLEHTIVGFSAYIPQYAHELIPSAPLSNYVTTTCITPKFRGQGISKQLNDCLENGLPATTPSKVITRRTWTTNTIQIQNLSQRGYHILKEIEHDRGPGISTLYYILERK